MVEPERRVVRRRNAGAGGAARRLDRGVSRRLPL